MTIAGDYIGRVRLGVTIDVAGSQSFVWPDGLPAGTYTADAGPDGAITLTVTTDGDTLTVAWAATDSRRMIGYPWRLLRDGTWLFGDLYVTEAEPVDQDPTETTVIDGTVEVRVAMVTPSGEDGGGADHVVAVFADDFAADGTFTEVPLHNGATIPRSYLTGTTILVVDGDQLGLWTVPASGPCTAGTALAAGDVVVAVNGLSGVAASSDGVTVDEIVVQATEAFVSEVETELAGDLDTLGNRVTATEAVATGAASHELVVAEARGRHATDPVFAMCWPGEDLGHDDHAWSTPVPANFTTGSWVRFDDLTVMPFTETDPGIPGEVVYSELFSQWHDGLGAWDNFEDAVQRKWDVDNQSWRSTLFFEWTPIGGTVEAHGPATEGVYDLPDGVPVTIVRHLEFSVSGNWRLRWFRRVWRETPTDTFDGADWALIHAVNGTGTTSIDTYTAEPWTFGCGTGRVHVRKVTVRDAGPAGTLLAEVDAADADAADGAAFTDGAGNTITPGVAARVHHPDLLERIATGLDNSDGGPIPADLGAMLVTDNGVFTLPALTEADHGRPLTLIINSSGATIPLLFVPGIGDVTDYALVQNTEVRLRWYGYGEGYWFVTSVAYVTPTSGGLDEAAVQALINTAVANLLDGAPGALDTLNELAAAINDDASFAAAVTTALAGKVPTTRTITAGTGLTGGGTLAADRTLAVAYGLIAGTAAEGIALPHATWRSGAYYGAAVPNVINSATAVASGVVKAMPFYNPVAGRVIDQLAIDIHTGSAGTGLLYVCTDDGTGYPGAVIASGTMSTPTTGTRSTATPSGTLTLPRGLLWLVAHGTGTTWSGLTVSGQSPWLPSAAAYSTQTNSCWNATGAGTSALTAFPAGAQLGGNAGVRVLLRAA